MEIKRAIITAAGKTQRTLPLQTLVDRDGQPKSALCIIADEIVGGGVEEICVVVAPGDADAYRTAAGPHQSRIQFVEQLEPLGYGHAVHCAAEFAGEEPFLLLVGDHLYVSGTQARCAHQLIEVAATEDCSVSAVQATHESKLPYYGTIGGRRLAGRQEHYEITEILEKPSPTVAEQRLVVPGLRAGHYLCFFGMHVLTPAVMSLLEEELMRSDEPRSVTMATALNRLADRERYLALEVKGRRYDLGLKYGLLTAQVALALSSSERAEVLASLVELLATRAE
jgi:UTP--glucose-1-phosphate uridylyltransferase